VTYRVLSLFAGIGGFDLGLERTGGFKTVAFCEIHPPSRAVLAQHWPEVPCYDDVSTLTADILKRDAVFVDIICGGFPCQDISLAGNRAGLGETRSGLWSEYCRLIRELQPRYVIVENVSALLSLGMGRVLGDLAAVRYDAEWHCIPASAVGAPHGRDRVWIVAYPANEQTEAGVESLQAPRLSRELGRVLGRTRVQFVDQPEVCLVDDGVSPQLDGHEALGNAVVPQIPELIGRAILASEMAA
jgi:DNA (cytosine-5)-methyltransferase 1